MTVAVGITGGIGSGKSTVCNLFKILGIPVFEADIIAKQLINNNPDIRKGLTDLFGADIYTPEEGINRKKLAGIIFNDDLQLNSVNQIIHPVVREEYYRWLKLQNSPYIIHEAAILFESGFYKMMDFTVLISAPEEMRVKRVSERDGITAGEVRSRIKKQWPDSRKRSLATVEIVNDNREMIIPRIINMDKQLREYGKIW